MELSKCSKGQERKIFYQKIKKEIESMELATKTFHWKQWEWFIDDGFPTIDKNDVPKVNAEEVSRALRTVVRARMNPIPWVQSIAMAWASVYEIDYAGV
jgi:hypothetical protein